MKRLAYILISLAALLQWTACSSIDENERLVYVPLNYVVPTEGVPRHVLIEDFTGQDCPNCPTATDVIGQLQQAYGSIIVPVAIHSGPMSVLPTKDPEGLATALGNSYYDYWKVEVQPQGVINRSGGVLSYTDWIAKTAYDIRQQATSPVDIRVQPISIDEATGELTGSVGVVAVKDSVALGKLQLWLTEDSIVAFQDMPTGKRNGTYVHNHVLRAALNGSWGEDVSVADGSQQTFDFRTTLDPKWRTDKLAVVAFLYNGEGVVQAARRTYAELDDNSAPVVPQDSLPSDTIGHDTIPSTPTPQDSIPEEADYDTTFRFVDADGNEVANGQTIVITRLEGEQMNTGLSIQNISGADAAGVMLCDITAMPNGTFTSCAFGQCLAPWTEPDVYQSYKSIIRPGTLPQPILTEWLPEAYGEWECTFQLCTLNIITQNIFGMTTQRAGDEITAYGPKITVRFVYDSTSAE